jgi:tryptophan-rich sensory protein
MNNKNLMRLFYPIVIGFTVSKFCKMSKSGVNVKFRPPPFVFGIVWPILYLLMAIVSFLNAQTVYRLYLVQLCLNGIWSWIFFVFNGLGLAFLNIVVLILLNVLIVRKLRVKGAWLSFSLYLPYLLWITFAAILNLSILVMN